MEQRPNYAMHSGMSEHSLEVMAVSMPIVDFLTTYWPYDSDAGRRVLNSEQPITPEVAQDMLPRFLALENYIKEKKISATRDVDSLYGLKPDQVSSMAIRLGVIADIQPTNA